MFNQIVFFKGNQVNNPTQDFKILAGATAVTSGQPCILTGTNLNVQAAPDASPVIGTHVFAGFSNGSSSQTASVNGIVDLYVPLQYAVLMLPAKVPANIATQAQYDALVGHYTLFDLTGGVYTVDESANSALNGLIIVPLNVTNFPGMVAFVVRQSATWTN